MGFSELLSHNLTAAAAATAVGVNWCIISFSCFLPDTHTFNDFKDFIGGSPGRREVLYGRGGLPNTVGSH